MARNALIQVRRDTAANWTSVNPTLAAGEIGFESDTNLFKIGTGSTAWASLGYSAVTTTSTSTLTNKTLTSPKETWSVSATAAGGVVNVDILTASSFYYTANSTATAYFNFRGNSGVTLGSLLAVGQSVTVTFLVTNGSSAYSPSSYCYIDGLTTYPKWQGGLVPPVGNGNSIDAFVFVIVKTSASPAYTVLASMTKFA